MLLFIIMVIVFLKSVVLYRGLHVLPVVEIKRRARNRDPRASAVYKLSSNQQGLDLLLIILGAVSAVGLIIISSRSSWWAACIAILLVGWLISWSPKQDEAGLLWKFSSLVAPWIYKWTKSFMPLLNRLAEILPHTTRPGLHFGIYEKEDLLDIINNQNQRLDNRIPKEDLQIASNALTFGDKKVTDVMVPRRKVRFVSETELIGPMLMDELHKTGQTIFPVIKSASKPAEPEVCGLLALTDLIENPDKGQVKAIMQTGKATIAESADLRTALDEFIKAKKHLLAVTNNFEEVVGVISIDQVLQQILGKEISDEIGIEN